MAITDLTNTTWKINSLTCSAGYGQFYVGSTLTRNGEYYGTVSEIYIGYELNIEDFSRSQKANSVMFGDAAYVKVDDIITFDSGSDVTNSNLISWVTSSATQIVEEQKPSTKIKSPCVVIQNKVKQVVIDNANMTIDVYTNEMPKELISFTVGGVSYQAEEGMTWKQWCNSKYNTKGAYIMLGNGVNTVHWEDYSGTYFYAVSKGDGTVVNESDIIISNYSYSQKRVAHSGGGSD